MESEKLIQSQFDIDYPENGELNVGSIYEVYKKAFESASEINKEKQQLDFANQQLVGFYSGKHENVISLIKAMGLSYSEWTILKSEYEPILDDSDLSDIEDYFNNSIF